jgi:transmembrane sensor
MITREEFIALFEKYQQGRCTPEEIRRLESFKDDIYLPGDEWDAALGNQEETYRQIKSRLYNSTHQPAAKAPVRMRWLAVAASILLLLSAGGYYLMTDQTSGTRQGEPATATTKQPPVIAPGGNKAYLTTANGITIALNDVKKGAITTQGAVQVTKLDDGELAYHPLQTGHEESATAIYNTISIPRGGQYKIVLADGTRVWLNSASQLRYPAAFTGRERNVELTGEAYFEVAKNKTKPFRVQVNGTTVQVLGTHFNINGYDDEAAVKTTLLEGSVKLINSRRETLLKPGEQGVFDNTNTAFNIKKVNVEEVVAWKNGFFVFNNENIQSIMKRISRWYDVDVVISKEVEQKRLGGTVSRFRDVTQVLHSIELTGSVHFKVEGRKITVMP